MDELEKARQINIFRDLISENESSGGRNMNHPEVKEGIHAGDKALGKYGLMPNTVNELLNKYKSLNRLNDAGKNLRDMPGSDLEEAMSRKLAEELLDKHGYDMGKAAYAWRHGHNIKPKDMDSKPLDTDPYVQKLLENRKKILGPEARIDTPEQKSALGEYIKQNPENIIDKLKSMFDKKEEK